MARGRGRRLMGDINVVPYIDVMLVLLIIFMVTAPLLTQGVEVKLPAADAAPLDQELLSRVDPLILTVTSNGSLYLNIGEKEDEPLEERAVVVMAEKVLERTPQTPVLVRADTDVPYGRVVAGMVLLQAAGAPSVGLVTEPPAPQAVEGGQ